MAEEEKGVDSDLIRGHIDTIILKVLKTGDRYGLEIIEDVSKASAGLYELKQPTLYSCLKRLEGQGLISSYWTDSDIGGKRHYYKLTEQGSEVLAKNQSDWAKSRSIIESLIYEDVPAMQNATTAFQQQNPTVANASEPEVSEVASEDDNIFDATLDDVSTAEAAEIYSEYKDEQHEEAAAEAETIEDDDKQEEAPVIEDELLAFGELEAQRKANEPTALELAAEGQEEAAQELYNKELLADAQSDEPEIEFSTFENEGKTEEQTSLFDQQEEMASYATKQDALDILFGNHNDEQTAETESEPEETAPNVNEPQKSAEEAVTTVEVENETVENPIVDKSIELSKIPDDPTYEQKQTLKMFEANTVNASLTDNGFKERLTELSSYTLKTPKDAEQKRNSIEYHPEDYNTINQRFKQWGISVRTHKKIEKPKEEKTHFFKNKIHLVTSWITFGITALLLLISLAIIAGAGAKYMTAKNALPLYLPFIVVLFLYPIIVTIIHSLDPNKRVPAKYAPRLSIIAAVLFFIQAVIITYAINLQTGLVSFAQKGYNHLGWIVPCIASLAILIQAITYYFLYKSKKFHN